MYGIKELVENLAQKRGITKVSAQEIVNDVVDVFKEGIKESGGVSIKNVFTIKQRVRKGREGEYNGKKYSTPDKKTLKIVVGKEFDMELNE